MHGYVSIGPGTPRPVKQAGHLWSECLWHVSPVGGKSLQVENESTLIVWSKADFTDWNGIASCTRPEELTWVRTVGTGKKGGHWVCAEAGKEDIAGVMPSNTGKKLMAWVAAGDAGKKPIDRVTALDAGKKHSRVLAVRHLNVGFR